MFQYFFKKKIYGNVCSYFMYFMMDWYGDFMYFMMDWYGDIKYILSKSYM
jgi:hypothetical protein